MTESNDLKKGMEIDTQKQKEYMSIRDNYDRLRDLGEGLSVDIADLIKELFPKQSDGEQKKYITMAIANAGMSYYHANGQPLEEDQVLANREKDFLPQPGMLAFWAEEKKFETIDPIFDETTGQWHLDENDVKGKMVLTYYPPFAKSWLDRNPNEGNKDYGSNRHWYSHCKSSLYAENGDCIGCINPETTYNAFNNDAKTYVPYDSVSYVINYQDLDLDPEDIKDGFYFQQLGINTMDPTVQEMIFTLKENGLTNDDIARIWSKNKIDFTNPENLNTINKRLDELKKECPGNSAKEKEEFLNKVKEEFEINVMELSTAENEYNYNLQDYSCAIRPTAPIIYATAAKINRKPGIKNEEIHGILRDIGLYNIYDDRYKNLEIDNKNINLNKEFYNKYKESVYGKLADEVKVMAEEFWKNPKLKSKDYWAFFAFITSRMYEKIKIAGPMVTAYISSELNNKDNDHQTLNKALAHQTSNNSIPRMLSKYNRSIPR